LEYPLSDVGVFFLRTEDAICKRRSSTADISDPPLDELVEAREVLIVNSEGGKGEDSWDDAFEGPIPVVSGPARSLELGPSVLRKGEWDTGGRMANPPWGVIGEPYMAPCGYGMRPICNPLRVG
jgi:hypothetical protein